MLLAFTRVMKEREIIAKIGYSAMDTMYQVWIKTWKCHEVEFKAQTPIKNISIFSQEQLKGPFQYN